MLLLRSFRKRAAYMLICFALFLFSTNIWTPSYLIVPLPFKGIVDLIETITPLLTLLPLSFVLHDSYEIELGLTCGLRTERLMMCQYIPILLYTLVNILLMILCYQHRPFSLFNEYPAFVPINIPNAYKTYLIISATTTAIFFSALQVLIRVVCKNSYVAVSINICVYLLFLTQNFSLRQGRFAIHRAILDPFISTYFLGDSVPLELGLGKVWTTNRVLYVTLSFFFFFISCWLLRREKTHEDSEE